MQGCPIIRPSSYKGEIPAPAINNWEVIKWTGSSQAWLYEFASKYGVPENEVREIVEEAEINERRIENEKSCKLYDIVNSLNPKEILEIDFYSIRSIKF